MEAPRKVDEEEEEEAAGRMEAGRMESGKAEAKLFEQRNLMAAGREPEKLEMQQAKGLDVGVAGGEPVAAGEANTREVRKWWEANVLGARVLVRAPDEGDEVEKEEAAPAADECDREREPLGDRSHPQHARALLGSHSSRFRSTVTTVRMMNGCTAMRRDSSRMIKRRVPRRRPNGQRQRTRGAAAVRGAPPREPSRARAGNPQRPPAVASTHAPQPRPMRRRRPRRARASWRQVVELGAAPSLLVVSNRRLRWVVRYAMTSWRERTKSRAARATARRARPERRLWAPTALSTQWSATATPAWRAALRLALSSHFVTIMVPTVSSG